MNLTLRFGALAPKIKNQLPPGVTIDAGNLEHFQLDADAITRLGVRGLISAVALKAARQKLMNRVVEAARRAA